MERPVFLPSVLASNMKEVLPLAWQSSTKLSKLPHLQCDEPAAGSSGQMRCPLSQFVRKEPSVSWRPLCCSGGMTEHLKADMLKNTCLPCNRAATAMMSGERGGSVAKPAEMGRVAHVDGGWTERHPDRGRCRGRDFGAEGPTGWGNRSIRPVTGGEPGGSQPRRRISPVHPSRRARRRQGVFRLPAAPAAARG